MLYIAENLLLLFANRVHYNNFIAMSIKGNIIKGWITSIVGTLLMLSSLFLWFIGIIPLLWEGAVGLILGCVLLFAPKTIEKKISEIIKAWGGKNNSTGYLDNDPKIQP